MALSGVQSDSQHCSWRRNSTPTSLQTSAPSFYARWTRITMARSPKQSSSPSGTHLSNKSLCRRTNSHHDLHRSYRMRRLISVKGVRRSTATTSHISDTAMARGAPLESTLRRRHRRRHRHRFRPPRLWQVCAALPHLPHTLRSVRVVLTFQAATDPAAARTAEVVSVPLETAIDQPVSSSGKGDLRKRASRLPSDAAHPDGEEVPVAY